MTLTLLENGFVFTPKRRFHKGAVLLKGGRIEAVLDAALEGQAGGGEGPADRERLRDADRIDLGGAFVLPGFVDTHLHLASLALKKLRCDLGPARSLDELLERTRAYVDQTDFASVVGVDFDESRWNPPAFPTREMLDRIESKRPLLVRRICGHVGVGNTRLIERVGAHAGLIDREAGLLREHALWEASHLSEPPPEALSEHIEGAIRELHRLGITAIHDIVDPVKFDAYVEGVRASKAPLRIDMLIHVHPKDIAPYRDACGGDDPARLRLAGVKCFLDGSLGGRTAALNAPYADAPGERGTLLVKDADLVEILEQTFDAGYTCALHAIGDRAIDQALRALAPYPRDERRVRIEHCEIVGSEQLAGLERSPVFLSLQPNFVRNWGGRGGLYEKRLGHDRFARCNPFQTFIASGIDFVFGSDGMPPGPLYGLQGAIAHPLAAERISREEAIARYSEVPNRIGRHARDAGTIERGRLADLVVLDKNPLEVDLDQVRVLKTIVNGEIVFTL